MKESMLRLVVLSATVLRLRLVVGESAGYVGPIRVPGAVGVANHA
jgi:hypothetical protein